MDFVIVASQPAVAAIVSTVIADLHQPAQKDFPTEDLIGNLSGTPVEIIYEGLVIAQQQRLEAGSVKHMFAAQLF